MFDGVMYPRVGFVVMSPRTKYPSPLTDLAISFLTCNSCLPGFGIVRFGASEPVLDLSLPKVSVGLVEVPTSMPFGWSRRIA